METSAHLFPDLGRVARGERGHVRPQRGRLERRRVAVRVRRQAQQHVLAQRGVLDPRRLRAVRDGPANRHIASTCRRLAQQPLEERRLARADSADDHHERAARDRQLHAFQHRRPGRRPGKGAGAHLDRRVARRAPRRRRRLARLDEGLQPGERDARVDQVQQLLGEHHDREAEEVEERERGEGDGRGEGAPERRVRGEGGHRDERRAAEPEDVVPVGGRRRGWSRWGG
jgi:hypothetical protein